MACMPDLPDDDAHTIPAIAAWLATGATLLDGEGLELHDFRQPGPYVLRAWHGTTRTFTQFDRAQSCAEAQFGRAFYFTTDPQDAWANYAQEAGPDVASKLAHLQERLYEHYCDDPEAFGLEDADEDTLQEAARTAARAEVLGPNPEARLMECALRIQRPFLVGGYTRWPIPGLSAWDDLTPAWDGDEEDIGEDDEEAREEAWQEAYEAAYQAQAQILSNAFAQAAWALGLEPADLPVPAALLDDRFDGTSADLEDAIRKAFGDLQDPNTGEIITSAVLGAVVEALGFDAIILLGADRRFTRMDMAYGTAHLHLFAHTPEALVVVRTHTDTPAFAMAA